MSVADIDMNRTTATRYCRQCLYDLAGLPENRCPECGTEFDPTDRASYLQSKRWVAWPRALKWTATVLGILFLIGIVLPMFEPVRVHGPCLSPAAKCALALDEIGMLLVSYVNRTGVFPEELHFVVRDRAGVDVPRCPYYGDGSNNLGYCYVKGLSGDDAPESLIAYDALCHPGADIGMEEPHRDTCNVLYLSGEVRSLTVEAFRREFARFHTDFVTARRHPPDIQCPPPVKQPTQ